MHICASKMQFRNAKKQRQDFLFIPIKDINNFIDEVSYTLIGEPGQTGVKLEYRVLEIVMSREFRIV